VISLGGAVAIVVAVLNVTPPSTGATSDEVLFGAYPGLVGSSNLAALNALEADLGRELDLVRVYERWDAGLGGAFHNEILNSDRVMLLSVRSARKNGTIIPWRDVANAKPGQQIYNEMVNWVEAIGAVDTTVWFAFHAEPDYNPGNLHGQDHEYIAAHRRIVDEFRARGVSNVKFVWIMTDWAFDAPPSDSFYAPKWYPGDSYVDHLAADPYNWSECRSNPNDKWRPLEDAIRGFRDFGADHSDKGLILAEWSSTEAGDGGAAKAAWLNGARELFKKPGWEQFVALSFFNRLDTGYPNCEWPAASTPAAYAAFKQMAADPFYDGGLVPGPGGFVDVSNSSVFGADIAWLASQGITAGCNPPANNRFCPRSAVTRGQMAAFLVRAMGYTNNGGGNLFIDDNGSLFEGDIDRLATAGITNGCNPPTNTRFCPDTELTREQMAAFLVRAMKYTNPGSGDLFIDDNSSIFEGDIDRLGTAGVTKGCNPPTNDRYCPSGNVTRAQMAAFLHRALG
jgi:hypothetical protein